MRSGKLVRGAGWILPPLLLAVLLSGCAGWRSVRTVEVGEPPGRFLQADSAGEFSDVRWWVRSGDTTLATLVDRALEGNLTLAQQVARLEASRSQYAAARASWFPTLSAQGSYTRADYLEEPPPLNPQNFSGGPIQFTPFPWDVGASASYELDLFGKLHASRQAARADLEATRDDLRAYLLSLSGQVGRSWYAVLALREQQDLNNATVRAYERNLELVEERFERGVVTSVDLYQARTNLASARSRLASAGADLAAAEHQLAVLLGEYPSPEVLPEGAMLPDSLLPLRAGLPRQLLARRPDVRAAWARLVAADRRAAQADAARLPSLTLTGTLGGRGEEFGDAIDPQNILWQAIGSLSAPLFQGGRLKANADAADARWRQAAAGYRETVLNAFREVEDALAGVRARREALAHTRAQVEAARASLEMATDRYRRGVTDYLPVVMAQTAYYNARSGLIGQRQALLGARIQLALALGGDWTEEAVRRALEERGEEVGKAPLGSGGDEGGK